MVSPRLAVEQRIHNSLYGLALGDALGMPTQEFSRSHIARDFGDDDGLVARFYPGPSDNRISAGQKAGTVTDDTDQALILARRLIAGGGAVDARLFAEDLLAWQDKMIAAGSVDLLGPSTLRALEGLRADGAESTAGKWGATDGAAMRVAPIAHVVPVEVETDLDALVDRVVEVSRLTHGTGVALAGACAVAGAVAARLAQKDWATVVDWACIAAAKGAERGVWVAAADIATKIRWTCELVESAADAESAFRALEDLCGTSLATQEAVPATFGMLQLAITHGPGIDDLWFVARASASSGGDCDTIAAMAGAISGAGVTRNAALLIPEEIAAEFDAANDLGLYDLAAGLRRVREGSQPS